MLSLLFIIEPPLPQFKPRIKSLAEFAIPFSRPGDRAQALMDLGATICTPKSASCLLCPLNDNCKAQAADMVAVLPKKQPRKVKPKRQGLVFWIEDKEGRVLLRRRPQKGLLAGMLEFPGTVWREELTARDMVDSGFDVEAMEPFAAKVKHVFTHFELTLEPRRLKVNDHELSNAAGLDAQWVAPEELDEIGLPSVMLKVAKLCRTT